jgi:hypothetical protein
MSVLKRVPKKSWTGDMRRQFFIDNANSNKYYYMPVGDVQNNPHRNTLVPLGTFLGFINFRGQVPVLDDKYYNNDNYSYFMRFSNYPYNSTENWSGPISMETDPLVYTDEPPAAGSVPLHYYDYVQMAYGTQVFDENGRPMINEQFPTAFGDGENGWGAQTLRPPGQVSPQLQQSSLGAANFVAKRGGKKTRKRKNRKLKKTRKHKRRGK